jgi:hypothetical protein
MLKSVGAFLSLLLRTEPVASIPGYLATNIDGMRLAWCLNTCPSILCLMSYI